MFGEGDTVLFNPSVELLFSSEILMLTVAAADLSLYTHEHITSKIHR